MHLEGKPGRQKSCQQAKHAVCKAPLKVTNKKGKPLIASHTSPELREDECGPGPGPSFLISPSLPAVGLFIFQYVKGQNGRSCLPQMNELPQEVFKDCRNPGASERASERERDRERDRQRQRTHNFITQGLRF